MPTRPSRRRLVASYVAAVALLTSGCSLLDGEDPDAPASGSPSAGVEITDAPPDTLTGLRTALERRADAVLRGDEEAFLAGLVKDDADLRDQQATYFANLQQLPVGTFAYTVDPQNVVREGDAYRVVVDLALQLDGFDEQPVVTRDRFLFVPAGRPGRFRLASVADLAWEAENPSQAQPWDLGPIEVLQTANVLGIFDRASRGAARPLIRSVERGIAAVAGVVPSSWSRTVTLYALSDTAFLATLPGLPGADATALDAVAFPVFGSPDGGDPAATRIALHPRTLSERGRDRDRLVRHELAHVAIADADDDAPVWLAEGLAEYVSVQPLSPERRRISEAAIEAAREGVTEMPDDGSFNDAATPGRASANYGIAWFACEYLAASYGEVTLWQLLAAFDRPDLDADEVLVGTLGINVRTLARKAGKLILTTYDAPDPEPTDVPTDAPTELPTGVPTDGSTGSVPADSTPTP